VRVPRRPAAVVPRPAFGAPVLNAEADARDVIHGREAPGVSATALARGRRDPARTRPIARPARGASSITATQASGIAVAKACRPFRTPRRFSRSGLWNSAGSTRDCTFRSRSRTVARPRDLKSAVFRSQSRTFDPRTIEIWGTRVVHLRGALIRGSHCQGNEWPLVFLFQEVLVSGPLRFRSANLAGLASV